MIQRNCCFILDIERKITDYLWSYVVAFDKKLPIFGNILRVLWSMIRIPITILGVWFMIGMILSIPFLTIMMTGMIIEIPLIMNNQSDAVTACYESSLVNNETIIPILENGGVFTLAKHMSGWTATSCLFSSFIKWENMGENSLQSEL